MPGNIVPSYNALDGNEVAKLIALGLYQEIMKSDSKRKAIAMQVHAQFLDGLKRESYFKPHLTYPSISWDVLLDFQGSWSLPPDFRWSAFVEIVYSPQAGTAAETKQTFSLAGVQGNSGRSGAPHIIIESKGMSRPAPDEDRDTIGAEKPRPIQTTGGIVDWPKTS
jgi:hypothetical protein